MREKTLRLPLDVVAGRLADEEGLGTALVSVLVDAFFDSIIEDLTAGDGLAGWKELVYFPCIVD